MRFGDLLTILLLGLGLEVVSAVLWVADLGAPAVALGVSAGLLVSIGVVSISVLFALRVHEGDREKVSVP